MLTPPRPALMIAALSAAALALSACGSDSLATDSGAKKSEAPAPSGAAKPELVAKVPAKIKDAGKIVVGTGPNYPPNEFLGDDGKTVVGMDVDVFAAVAAQFGLEVEWVPANFDAIITGVQSGKYDVGISSFTINDKRKQQVNMVSYFKAGTQWAAAAGNPKKVDPDSPCGLDIAVQKGTVQEEVDLPARLDTCEKAGKPVNRPLPYAAQNQVTAAVVSGKVDAMLADSPVVAYAIKQSGGKIEAAGDIYDAAPYGYVLPKDQPEWAQAVADALKAAEADGSYKKALGNWGTEAGAISDFAVNP
jgi:polar amino acid transport system substrate-binding protein